MPLLGPWKAIGILQVRGDGPVHHFIHNWCVGTRGIILFLQVGSEVGRYECRDNLRVEEQAPQPMILRGEKGLVAKIRRGDDSRTSPKLNFSPDL